MTSFNEPEDTRPDNSAVPDELETRGMRRWLIALMAMSMVCMFLVIILMGVYIVLSLPSAANAVASATPTTVTQAVAAPTFTPQPTDTPFVFVSPTATPTNTPVPSATPTDTPTSPPTFTPVPVVRPPNTPTPTSPPTPFLSPTPSYPFALVGDVVTDPNRKCESQLIMAVYVKDNQGQPIPGVFIRYVPKFGNPPALGTPKIPGYYELTLGNAANEWDFTVVDGADQALSPTLHMYISSEANTCWWVMNWQRK